MTFLRPGQTRRPPKLTGKQSLFADALASGKNQTEAAIIAGYKNANNITFLASRLASKPHVQAAIARARTEYAELHTWSVDYWRNWLLNVKRKAEQAEDIPSEIRLLELAGRHLGALDPQAPLSPAAQALMDALASAMVDRQLNSSAATRARTHVLTEGVTVTAPEPEEPAK